MTRRSNRRRALQSHWVGWPIRQGWLNKRANVRRKQPPRHFWSVLQGSAPVHCRAGDIGFLGCHALRVSSRRTKLPMGWSHPINPSEVPISFPGVETVYWNGPPQGWQKGTRPAIWLRWSPRSMQPQPVLTVWGVPSADRSRIRQWITEEVAPEAAHWLSGIETATETWRDSEHSRTWNWSQAV